MLQGAADALYKHQSFRAVDEQVEGYSGRKVRFEKVMFHEAATVFMPPNAV
jgi:hypothetical protein